MIRGSRRSVVSDALERLAVDLDARLRHVGWMRQRFLPEKVAIFTRPVGDGGYFATVELIQVGRVRRGETWPADLYLRYGCGHWPTFELMPKVGLEPDPVLVEEPAAAERPMPTTRASNEADLVRVFELLADQISRHTMDWAASLSTDASMQAALSDDYSTPLDVRIELLPAFLRAVGRTKEAAEVADRYLHERVAEDQDEYAEFVSALHAVAGP